MTVKKAFALLLGPLAMILATGCASTYHSYSDCYVDCKYCVPPPLAYTNYDEQCVCHSDAVAKYLLFSQQPIEQKSDVILHQAEVPNDF